MDHPDATTCPLPADALRLRVAALTALQGRVKSELDAARDELHGAMSNGEGHTIWSPAAPDEQIATLNRAKPKPKAHVTDGTALDRWLVENYPDDMRRVRSATDEGLQLLSEMAPDLLAEDYLTPPEWLVGDVLRASEKAREPVHPDGTTGVPGVRVATAPEGRLSVRLHEDAERLVSDLIAQGQIDSHGLPRQIEANP